MISETEKFVADLEETISPKDFAQQLGESYVIIKR